MARKIGAAGGDLRRRNSFPPSIVKFGVPQNRRFCGACGIGIKKYSDIKEGDVIEAFMMEQIEV